MYTCNTLLGSYGVKADELSKYYSITGVEGNVLHVEYVELEAMMRGEKVTPRLIGELAASLHWESSVRGECPIQRGRDIRIVCKDGEVSPQWVMETLCRHFVLFQDFFQEYPNEHKITIPTIGSKDMIAILEALSEKVQVSLTTDILHALHTLNPVNNGYFLFFHLNGLTSDVVIDLVKNVSQVENNSIVRAGVLWDAVQLAEIVNLPLPADIEVLCATSYGRAYLATQEGSKLVKHNGWSFVNMIGYEEIELAADVLGEFHKDEFVGLTKEEREKVADSLCKFAVRTTNKGHFVTACTMLGIYHEELGNVDRKVYTPYHILPNRINLYEWKDCLKHAMGSYGYKRAKESKRLS
jgi:hypothetical protein